jgi:choline dehydrogenase-like flavoprotein
MSDRYDFIIIGSGIGGGTLTYALRSSGAKMLLLERGDFLPQEAENWQADAVIKQKRYQAKEQWFDDVSSKAFQPATYYFVGGNSKMYGAAFPRFREKDFEATEFEEGLSPAWPIAYDDLEPYYAEAEKIYLVHGTTGEDLTEPRRSSPYPFPPVPHEPYHAELSERLKRAGYHPFSLPVGVDLREGGKCIRCGTCDGFPCKLLAKGDADACCVRPALEFNNVTLQTNTYARKLLTSSDGKRVTGVEVEYDGETKTLYADTYVVACGATHSTALLLRSATDKHPNGLANSSGLLGRNYMAHINSVLIAIDPKRQNRDVFQKTLAVNDFYFGSDSYIYPMGNLQMMGKIQAAGYIRKGKPHITQEQSEDMAQHSADIWVMSEDLPDPNNRVLLGSDGSIRVRREFKGLRGHHKLMEHAEKMLREIGFKDIVTELMPIETNSHQCGTMRFGNNPETSVLDPYCKTWDMENLYVMDASFFPSSTAMNPALTIAAQSLRVAEHLEGIRHQDSTKLCEATKAQRKV